MTDLRSNNPMKWTQDDVSLWLRQCNLEKLIPIFKENNIDGLILMSNEFDENIIKDRIVFDIARKSLYQKISIKNPRNINQNSIIIQRKKRHIFQSISMKKCRYWNTCKYIYTQHMIPNIPILPHNKIPFLLIIMVLFLIVFNYYSIRESSNIRRIDKSSFDLYDDDGLPLKCPSYTEFNINNRRHLVVMMITSLKIHLWKNFLGLLCSGLDVYMMFDEEFHINSSSRIDAQPHSKRNSKSYSHRFLFISNESLIKNGIHYMNKLPSIQFTAWDRTVAWLYTLSNFTTVWLIEQDVQWYHPNNMTKLFDLFISDTTDIICANIVQTNTSWSHWPSTKSDIFPDIYWTGSFSPLVRWSYRLVQSHQQYIKLIHRNRLKIEFNIDFRFQEFIFTTIAKMENFTLGVYKHLKFLNIGLNIFDDQQIIQQIIKGIHIIHRIKHDSILTKYQPDQLAEIIQTNYTKIKIHTFFSYLFPNMWN